MTALVTKHLPLVVGAPDGIKLLRQLVIDLAIRGRLVTQDSADGLGEDLLCEIDSSRLALVRSGAIRQPKDIPEVSTQDELFSLPASWCWTRLGRITNFGSTTKEVNIPEDAWLLDLEDVEKDSSRLLKKVRFADRQSLSDKNAFNEGDVLYCKLRPYLNKVIVADESGYCTTEILPFRCYGHWAPHYFKYALKSSHFLNYVNAKSYGMKMPRLGTEDGRMALFPLPPVAEQRRIVAKVDELMALCDRLEADQADAEAAHAQLVQALLDSLTKATDAADFRASWQRLSEHFHTLFTTEASIDALKQTVLQLAVMGKLVPQIQRDGSAMDLLGSIAKMGKSKAPVTPVVDENLPAVPPSWCWVRIADMAHVGTGATPSRTNPAYFDPPEISWVTSGETSQPFVQSAEQKVSPLALNETNLTVYPVGTLVVAMYGQGKTRGQVTELLIEACTNQACAAIQLTCDDSAHRKFVKYFFEKSYDELRSLAAGGAQPNLNLGKIKETLIPLPPLAEQHRIVAKVDELMALCDQLKVGLVESRQLHLHLATALVEHAVA